MGEERNSRQEHRAVNRRQFLKISGIAAGTAVGADGARAALGDQLGGRWKKDYYFVGPSDEKPRSAARGTVYFETDTGDLAYYDGSGWNPFGRSSTDWEIVDLVEAGADPTGEEPIDSVVRGSYTGSELFYLPAGTYTLKAPLQITDAERFGFVGQQGATLRTAEEFGWSQMAIRAGERTAPLEEIYFKNLDIDLTATQNAHVGGIEAHFARQMDIENVRVSSNVGKWAAGLLTTATNERAFGRVNMDLSAGSDWVEGVDHFRDQPIGILVEDQHAGRLTFEDCIVGSFPNNGIYASQGSGRVDIVGGRYFDSNVSNIRVGSNASVRGATVTVDNSQNNYQNTVGIRVIGSEGNVVVDNVHVTTTNTSGHAVLLMNDGPVTLTNSRIDRTGHAGGHALHISGSEQEVGKTVIDNVTIDDETDASVTEYSMYVARADTVIRDSTINDDGEGTSGVIIMPDADEITLVRNTIDVPNYPLSLRGPVVSLLSNKFVRGKSITLPSEGQVVLTGNTFRNDGVRVPDSIEELTLDGNFGIEFDNAGLTEPRGGGRREYRFPHGLDATPDADSEVVVQPATADAAGAFHVAVEGDDIVVTYPTATPSGNDNLRWRFSASYRT